MRIAIDCRSAFPGMGGIGRYAWCLLGELLEIAPENEYIAYFTHFGPPEALPQRGSLATRSFQAAMIDERFDQLILPTALRDDRVDLYHNPTFAAPLLRTRARTVSTIHDVVFRRHPELVPQSLRRYLDQATSRAVRNADRLITVSEFSKRELLNLFPAREEKVSVIYNGVREPDPGIASASKNDRRELGEKGLVPGLYVLYVGSVEPKKNLSVLLQAFRELTALPGKESLKLAIAGSPSPDNPPIEREIEHLGLGGRALALGYVTEDLLESLYRHALAFVYPSLYEGFGFPPLEAMARGVPTVVSNAASLPEVVGEDALFFDPGSPRELAQVLDRLADSPDLREDLKRRGRERARRFTWRRSAEEHLALFESVMSGHESPSPRI